MAVGMQLSDHCYCRKVGNVEWLKEFVMLFDNRFASQDQTAQQDQYHALRVLLVMTVPLHLGMSPCVHLEPILIMEKEFAVHVPVARCAQILRSNPRYIFFVQWV